MYGASSNFYTSNVLLPPPHTKLAEKSCQKRSKVLLEARREKSTHRSGGESDDKCNYRRAERDCFIADKTAARVYIYIYFVSVVCLPRPQQCDGVVTLTKVSPTLCMRAETTIFLRPRPSHSRGKIKKNYIATIIIQAAFVYLRAAQPIISYNIRSKATKMVLTAPGRVPGH
jgi:hypothetical protein